jgi:hypothetical protein
MKVTIEALNKQLVSNIEYNDQDTNATIALLLIQLEKIRLDIMNSMVPNMTITTDKTGGTRCQDSNR